MQIFSAKVRSFFGQTKNTVEEEAALAEEQARDALAQTKNDIESSVSKQGRKPLCV